MLKKSIIYVLLIMQLVLVLSIFAQENVLKTIDVFHKNKPPALKTLKKVNLILDDFSDKYTITYYDILDSANIEIIESYNLPETHFPFAIVIDSKYSAMIDETKIDFVHFPLFMQGIGRHEGNWSMTHLQKVLTDNSLLLEENIQPILEEKEGEEGGDDPCED